MEEIGFVELVEKALDGEQPLPVDYLGLLSGMMPEEATLFFERWALAGPERRLLLLRALVELAESSFEMDFGVVFRHSLDDEVDEIRRTAVEGLWEDESASLVGPLVRMLLEDPSPQVREEAASSLGRFAHMAEMEELDRRRSDLVAEALLTAVRDQAQELHVRRRAVESIAFLSVDGLREIIDEAYDSVDPSVRASAILAMGRSADPFWQGTVISELSSDDPEIRFQAARACGELGAREAVPALCRLVGDRDMDVRAAAIWALGQIGGDTARRTLEACCESEDEFLAACAEEALAEAALTDGVLDITAFAVDDDSPVSEGESGWDVES
jgi:HEAT repeat protein